MSMFKVSLLTIMVFCFTLSPGISSEENNKPKKIIRHSRLLLEGNKRYVDDIEYGEKRYVSDRKDADEETKRWSEGWKKKYVDEETEEEFFRIEKKALYRFTSLQKNTKGPEDNSSRTVMIIEKEDAISDGVDIRVDGEKGVRNLEKERISLSNKRVVTSAERVSLNNKRIIESKERASLNNKRIIPNNERVSLGNKRVELEILEVIIDE